MEDELRELESQSLRKDLVQTLLDAAAAAVVEAAEVRDQDFADSPSLRKALTIVEAFLREKKRICYGGMAINAHLPQNKKFYDFRKTLPDYDFFTPEPEKDVEDLMASFLAAGFTEVSARVGMHEGTSKIFVNYTGVADITFMPQWMFDVLQKRAIVDDGIYYVDVDFLRMNMYLELSRPRGEVERWDKVYKRLLLLNMVKPTHLESCAKRKDRTTHVKEGVHQKLLEYITDHGLIFAGAELKRIYSHPNTTNFGYMLSATSPVITIAENPEIHVATVRQIIHSQEPNMDLKIMRWPALGEVIPEMYGLASKGRVIFLVIAERFCHAYNTVKLPNHKELKIAALDTAITLFYTLTFVRRLEGLVPKSVHCFADSLVEISMNTRDKNKPGKFPLFAITCKGHQPTKPSLLREKARRIAKMKITRRSRSKSKTPRSKPMTQKRRV